MKPPAFQFYVKDWLTDFKILTSTPEVKAAYIDLLCYLWLEEDTSLPDNIAAIANLLKVSIETANEIVVKFCKRVDGKITNLKLQEHKQEMKKFLESKSKAGIKGNNIRWKKPKKATSHSDHTAIAKPSPSSATASASSTTTSSSNIILPNGKTAELKRGNEEINKMLEACCQRIGIDAFASPVVQQRNFGKNLVGLYAKLGKDEFLRRLDILRNDDFKSKRMNQIDFVYRELKGFIEPIKKNNMLIL